MSSKDQDRELAGWYVLVLVYLVTCCGFVLSCGWDWFILPATGIDTPPYGICCGLYYLLLVLKTKMPEPSDKIEQRVSDGAVAKASWGYITFPWYALGTMWIIHTLAGG